MCRVFGEKNAFNCIRGSVFARLKGRLLLVFALGAAENKVRLSVSDGVDLPVLGRRLIMVCVKGVAENKKCLGVYSAVDLPCWGDVQ